MVMSDMLLVSQDFGYMIKIMKETLPLMRECLDNFLYPSKYERGMYAQSKNVFYSIRYKNPLPKSTILHLVKKLFLVL